MIIVYVYFHLQLPFSFPFLLPRLLFPLLKPFPDALDLYPELKYNRIICKELRNNKNNLNGQSGGNIKCELFLFTDSIKSVLPLVRSIIKLVPAINARRHLPSYKTSTREVVGEVTLYQGA